MQEQTALSSLITFFPEVVFFCPLWFLPDCLSQAVTGIGEDPTAAQKSQFSL